MKSDPLKKDSDNDGIIDNLDSDPETHFGIVNKEKYYKVKH